MVTVTVSFGKLLGEEVVEVLVTEIHAREGPLLDWF
jgi:hypothetical protein